MIDSSINFVEAMNDPSISQEKKGEKRSMHDNTLYKRKTRFNHYGGIDLISPVDDTAPDQTDPLQLHEMEEERNAGRLTLPDDFDSFMNDIAILVMASKERKQELKYPHERAILCTQRLYNLEARRLDIGKAIRKRFEQRRNRSDDIIVLAVSKHKKSNPAQIRQFRPATKKQEEGKKIVRRKRPDVTMTVRKNNKPNPAQIRLFRLATKKQEEGKMRRQQLFEESQLREKKRGLHRVMEFKSFSDTIQRLIMPTSPTESMTSFYDKSYTTKQDSANSPTSIQLECVSVPPIKPFFDVSCSTSKSNAANLGTAKQDPAQHIDDRGQDAYTLRCKGGVVISVVNDNIEVEVCFD